MLVFKSQDFVIPKLLQKVPFSHQIKDDRRVLGEQDTLCTGFR